MIACSVCGKYSGLLLLLFEGNMQACKLKVVVQLTASNTFNVYELY